MDFKDKNLKDSKILLLLPILLDSKWNVTPHIFEGGGDIYLQHILHPQCSFYPPSELHFLLACQPELARASIMRNSAWAYSLKCFQGGKESLQVLLENLQVLHESDIILLVGNSSKISYIIYRIYKKSKGAVIIYTVHE